jgi:hypothetical protein
VKPVNGRQGERRVTTRTHRRNLFASALGAAAVAVGLPAWAQAPHGIVDRSGVPDLEGTWSNVTITDFQRPKTYGDRLVLTPAEVAAMEGEVEASTRLANAPTDPNATVETLPNDCSGGRTNCNYNAQWTEPGSKVMRVHGEPRSSIVTYPADGRIPFTEAGRAHSGRHARASDNPEDRGLAERCLESQNINYGAVMVSTLYNNNYDIVQSPQAVAIIVEMSHDARIIRLNAKHRTDGVRPWFGDSIGRYEGDTLVVETTGFNPEQLAEVGASEQLRVTERFTRVGPDRLLYRFQVEDPVTYAKPWGGEYEFHPTGGPLYEYACHEGNRGLANILAGARYAEEQARAGKSAKPDDK